MDPANQGILRWFHSQGHLLQKDHFLKSLAIRTLNHEIYELPIGLNGMSNSLLRRRSILLARFVKRFADDLRIEPDHLYIAGLLYNLPYVSYEYLIKT